MYKRRSKSANKIPASASPAKYQRNSTGVDPGQKWWSMREFGQPGLTPQSVGLSLNNNNNGYHNSEMDWDISDSLEDLYHRINNQSKFASTTFRRHSKLPKVDTKSWFESDNSHGFIRVFPSENTILSDSQLIPCNVTTTADRICSQRGMPSNSLHVQLNGDIIRRLDPHECPLAIQNDYLVKIGYSDIRRIQEVGITEDLSFLVRFHAGKPFYDGTYSRSELSALLLVRKGKFIHEWVKRLCTIGGTRLSIYKEKSSEGKALEVQLARGAVEEVTAKGGRRLTLKLTSRIQGDKSVYLAFSHQPEYSKWINKLKRVTSKLPTRADLSHCHLEMLPDAIFVNDGLQSLNLRHNALRERPVDEDVYTIGWLDDLTRFFNLSNVNLSDNCLPHFPRALCYITTLVELDVSSNKIDDVPSEIAQLVNLQTLYLHNNQLTSLPASFLHLTNLNILLIAFNHFTTIPQCLLCPAKRRQNIYLPVDSLVLAGNFIESISPDILQQMRHLRKIDLRMNRLHLLPREMVQLSTLDLVTHLDLRDNRISNLDIRGMKQLQTVFCDSNKLEQLPDWISSCFFLVTLNISHNYLSQLPHGLLEGCTKLKSLHCNHNGITSLENPHTAYSVEEFYCHHNNLVQLPDDFLVHGNRLRVLNLSHNQLVSFPPINDNDTLNKVQELYLTANEIACNSLPRICRYNRLKILHLAYNCLTDLPDEDMKRLELLEELSISGNAIPHIPPSLCNHPTLTTLRANSNDITDLPDFTNSPHLKVLEVSSNHLLTVSMSSLMSSHINLLDISDNPSLHVDRTGAQERKRIVSVDMSGKNRAFDDLSHHQDNPHPLPPPWLLNDTVHQPWRAGFSHTSGNRNKLCVDIINKVQYTTSDDALFCVFDGGKNDEVIKLLHKTLPDIMQEEMGNARTGKDYLKYTILSTHKKLRSIGQKLGASLGICHITRRPDSQEYDLHLANVGDVAIVMRRRGNCLVLSRSFRVGEDEPDCQRILKSDGVITEDGRVNGITAVTRQIGSTYLYPQIIPDPHTDTIHLHHDDDFIIIANHTLWAFLTPDEAVEEIQGIGHPVTAAKRLQDLAQAYGAKENIAVLVVRLDIPVVDNSCRSSVVDVRRSGNVVGCDISVFVPFDGVKRASVSSVCDTSQNRVHSLGVVVPNDIVEHSGDGKTDITEMKQRRQNHGGAVAPDMTIFDTRTSDIQNSNVTENKQHRQNRKGSDAISSNITVFDTRTNSDIQNSNITENKQFGENRSGSGMVAGDVNVDVVTEKPPTGKNRSGSVGKITLHITPAELKNGRDGLKNGGKQKVKEGELKNKRELKMTQGVLKNEGELKKEEGSVSGIKKDVSQDNKHDVKNRKGSANMVTFDVTASADVESRPADTDLETQNLNHIPIWDSTNVEVDKNRTDSNVGNDVNVENVTPQSPIFNEKNSLRYLREQLKASGVIKRHENTGGVNDSDKLMVKTKDSNISDKDVPNGKLHKAEQKHDSKLIPDGKLTKGEEKHDPKSSKIQNDAKMTESDENSDSDKSAIKINFNSVLQEIKQNGLKKRKSSENSVLLIRQSELENVDSPYSSGTSISAASTNSEFDTMKMGSYDVTNASLASSKSDNISKSESKNDVIPLEKADNLGVHKKKPDVPKKPDNTSYVNIVSNLSNGHGISAQINNNALKLNRNNSASNENKNIPNTNINGELNKSTKIQYQDDFYDDYDEKSASTVTLKSFTNSDSDTLTDNSDNDSVITSKHLSISDLEFPQYPNGLSTSDVEFQQYHDGLSRSNNEFKQYPDRLSTSGLSTSNNEFQQYLNTLPNSDFPQYPGLDIRLEPIPDYTPPYLIEEITGKPISSTKVDRDAVLFHKMQQTMVKHGSSLASVQSVPVEATQDTGLAQGHILSHSIEVIVQPDSYDSIAV